MNVRAAKLGEHSIFPKIEPLGWGDPQNKLSLGPNNLSVLEVTQRVHREMRSMEFLSAEVEYALAGRQEAS